ncbi:MAG: hypothetical protein IJ766_06895 [Clostridia bacterium]|nr:hypothetical protein [Clostridia bacterium]
MKNDKNLCDDWRLTNQMNYLFGAVLQKCVYKELGNSDHEHCEFCWAKFGVHEDMLHVGYCTLDRYRWICPECYHDFKDMFRWKLTEISE